MNILVLQGPNLNLMGLKSSQLGEKITLDKLNRSLRSQVKNSNHELKILQTHKEFQAINFLQRNRNWGDSLLFIPNCWAKNNYMIFETINLIRIQTALVYFSGQYSFGTGEKESIFKGDYYKSFIGSPIQSCIEGLSFLLNQ